MQKVQNTDNFVLRDVNSKGRVRPWREKKLKTHALSNSYVRIGKKDKALRVYKCGTYLEFIKSSSNERLKLHRANFCKVRLCPVCAWQKSLSVFRELSRAMDIAQKEDKRLIPLFLTLTVKNCTGDALSSTLDTIFHGWNRFMSNTKMKRIIKGWFRSLEVTYNRQNDTYHPHVHVILLVDKGYFAKGNKDYMKTEDWVKVWRKSLRLDYDPICDIRCVKMKGKQGKKAVAEVSKYTVKDVDYLTGLAELTDKVVFVLDSALHRRRLYAYGGVLKEIAKRLEAERKAQRMEEMKEEEEAIRDDVESFAQTILAYRWDALHGNYFLH